MWKVIRYTWADYPAYSGQITSWLWFFFGS